MGAISTSFSVPCSIDRAVLAIQDALNQFGWPVLEMSSTLIVAEGPKLQPLQIYNLPKVSVKLSPAGDKTSIDVSVSMVGPIYGSKKQFTGIMGRLTNAISLRVQTESIAINPTVALGQGQGAATSVAPTTPARDRAQQLKDLKELLDGGVLTEAEFAAEKARILGTSGANE